MARPPGHGPAAFDPDETAWKDRAACIGLPARLFFPGSGANAASIHARAVCNRCPVQADCLAYAVRNGERFGVWGGLTELERRRLRQARAKRGLPGGGRPPVPGQCGNGHHLTDETVLWVTEPGRRERWRCPTCANAAKRRYLDKKARREVAANG